MTAGTGEGGGRTCDMNTSDPVAHPEIGLNTSDPSVHQEGWTPKPSSFASSVEREVQAIKARERELVGQPQLTAQDILAVLEDDGLAEATALDECNRHPVYYPEVLRAINAYRDKLRERIKQKGQV